MSGPDGMPGRRRAVPFEESATLIPTADEIEAAVEAAQEATPVIGGAHVRPPLGRDGRIATSSNGAHARPARPAARPANRAPVLPTGPVLLPPAERPPARPPGARRADVPAVVGPSSDAPAGRRVATVDPRASAPATTVVPVADPAPVAPEPAVRAAPAPVKTPAQNPAQNPAPTPAENPARRSPRPRATERPGPSRRAQSDRAPRLTRAGLTTGWLLLVLAAGAGVVLARTSPELPDLIRQASAGTLSVALVWALAVRTGGRPIWAAVLSAGLAVGAFVSGWDQLVAGASIGTGVVAATLAVMATTPAATVSAAIREVVIATGIAWIGALGVIGYGPEARPEVDPVRVGYVVLGLSLAGAFALVYRLGAGLHGLGRRGYVVAGGAVLMLAIAMAYTEAIAAWGSRDLVGSIDDLRDATRDALGAVPHPIVALLGYPALVWGVFMRARRRQGWWVCAFGVAATAPATTRLVAEDLSTQSVVLGAVYSFVIGIVIGYLVIRVEQSLTGTHGRRARRDEEAVAHRPEPSRTRPLH